MKSHRKHAPKEVDENDTCVYSGSKERSKYPKGRKQRLDELQQAIRTWWMYYEWIEEDKARKQECQRKGHQHGTGRYVWSCGWGDGWLKKSFESATKRMETLWEQATKDRLI